MVSLPSMWQPLLLLTTALYWLGPVQAAYVDFENCLDTNTVNSNPRLLQFVPLNVSAVFNTSDSNHNLNVTVYGNVTGMATLEDYPPPDAPSWSNPNDTFGKIPDIEDSWDKYTTLFTTLNVLSYTPYSALPARFCNATLNKALHYGYSLATTMLATTRAFWRPLHLIWEVQSEAC